MNLVWSDEAVCALVAFETRLAKQYSDEKAAQIVDALVRRVDHLRDHPQLGRVVPEYGRWQLRELSSTSGIEPSIACARTPSRS